MNQYRFDHLKYVQSLRKPAESQYEAALVTPPRRDDGPYDYYTTLGLSEADDTLCQELGEVVIDIGSGYEEFSVQYKEVAAREGIDAEVININPHLSIPEFRSDVTEQLGEQARPSVAGLVGELPLRDAIADSVVSSWAFPCTYDERREPEEAYVEPYREIVRVLKPGGTAYVGPTYSVQKNLGALEHVEGVHVEVVEGRSPFMSMLRITKQADQQ